MNIQADDADPDGKALRLAIAAGANVALHYLGEGGQVNYATAKEMGEPTARYFTERQEDMVAFLLDIVTLAHSRYIVATGLREPAEGDLRLEASVTEVARADNQSLATAVNSATQALTLMRQNGWIDDARAIAMAFKFAGETLSEAEIAEIMEQAEPLPETPAQEPPPVLPAGSVEPENDQGAE